MNNSSGRTVPHEVVQLFQQQIHPLSEKLTDMLNEHYSHQSERRGCGYTQATRLLAEYINQARSRQDVADLKLFEQFNSRDLRKIVEQSAMYQLTLGSWRDLDLQLPQLTPSIESQAQEFNQLLQLQGQWQQQLRHASHQVQREESKLICQLIEDVILPKTTQQTGLIALNSLAHKPKVGSCPMAEDFFLKIAHRHVLRQGEINIFVDTQQRPMLMEKLNMGDNHSCISLQALLMNGVRLPVGSLFSVEYDRDQIEQKVPNQQFKGFVMPLTAVPGFWFLRLTTLAISPENRKRAFSTHFEQQVNNGLYSPGTTQLQQLRDVAQAQVR